MALPKRKGLPVSPPQSNASPREPENTPLRDQNRETDTRSASRPKGPQNANRAASEQVSPRKVRPISNNAEETEKTKLNEAPVRRKRRDDTEQAQVGRAQISNVQNSNGPNRPEQTRTKRNKTSGQNDSVIKADKTEEKSTEQPKVEDGYAIDPKTGVKYRVLPGIKEEAAQAFNKLSEEELKNFTFSSLRNMVEEVEDFDIDDLNSTANDFLGHLRIPPNKEEQARLREERIRRKKEQAQESKRQQSLLNEKYGELKTDHDDLKRS